MNSWYTIRAQATGAEVLIYDEIGAYGVSAKGFLAELAALPDATPVALRLNSPGETQGARATPSRRPDTDATAITEQE